MRRVATALAVLAALGVLAAPAQARKHHRHHARGPAGVKGVVLDATCPGACAVPAPPEPVYAGAVTVVVSSQDGAPVASQAASAGRFRMQLRPGTYDVASVPPAPVPSCQPAPQTVCPVVAGPEPAALAVACETGETQRVEVRRHRFTHVELHVRNSCIV